MQGFEYDFLVDGLGFGLLAGCVILMFRLMEP